MPEVTIRDVVMWTKHIHGDTALNAHLQRLSAGGDVELVVDGVRGHWRKMADGKDGRPTTGLTPQGRMQDFWRELYASRRGQSVSIALPRGDGPDGPFGAGSASAPSDSTSAGIIPRTREVVEAARRALLTSRGWSSEGRTVTRDELHER